MSKLSFYKTRLENHSLLITDCIRDTRDLRIFMEHHVFAVWDFMSLAKSLQHHICPSGDLWLPTPQQRKLSRLINEIILAEESDLDATGDGYISHFDLYIQAMTEVGANTGPILEFIETVRTSGLDYAITQSQISEPAKIFMKSNFDVISTKEPHKIAAVFAYGRETIIPAMFKRIIAQVNDLDTPRFNYYLQRHVEVDGGTHGPSSLELVNFLCEYDPIKRVQAEDAAINAIQARIEFWNGVEKSLFD